MTVRLAMRVTMPDHTVWSIPLGIIAQHRAHYYAKLDSERGDGTYQDVYQQELAADEDDLLDWAHNNMDWSDVQSYARLVETTAPPPDYAGWWSNAEKQIVDGVL